MPLARRDSRHVPSSEGVYFLMFDSFKKVKCMITRGALADLAGRPLAVHELDLVFRTHRPTIEAIASRKYDNAHSRNNVVVAPPDLATSQAS